MSMSVSLPSPFLLVGLALLAVVLVACDQDQTALPTTELSPPAAGSADTAGDPRQPTAAAPVVAEAALPKPLADAQYESHGVFGGERYWLRLTPLVPAFGTPVLELTYTPPPRSALGGTLLYGFPSLAIDPRGRIRGWREASGEFLSKAWYEASPGAYKILRERERSVGDDVITLAEEATIESPPAWDLHLAPLLLSLVWRAGTTAEVPLVDLFGDGGHSLLSWQDTTVTCGPQIWHITSGPQGRVEAIADAEGQELLRVTQWLPDLSPADAADAAGK